VQQAQEAAAEAEAQCLRHLGLEVQRGIVELQLFQRVAQLVVLARFGRVEAREHLRLDFLEAGQRLLGRAQVVGQLLLQRDGVAHLRGLQFLDARDDVAHLARVQRGARLVGRSEHAQVVGVVGRVRGHHLEALALQQATVDHAHQHDHAHVGIEPAVDDHRAQRRVRVAARGRHAGDDQLQDLVDAHAGLGGAGNRVGRVDADHVLDLGLRVVRIGLRQIHLVEHRQHLDAEVQRRVAVGHRLRLDALRGIDHQQRAFAGRKRTGDFVREVHVARRVDEVEVVDLPVLRLVLQCGRLGLDGYPTLFLDVHRVEHLGFHLAVGQAAAPLDQPVSQRRFAVIDVRNDREISDVIHQREATSN